MTRELTECRSCKSPVRSSAPSGENTRTAKSREAAPKAMIAIVVPGEPHAQGRPRAFSFRGKDGQHHTRVYDPPASRSWKGMARVHVFDAIERGGFYPIVFPAGPVFVEIEAVFACPVSRWRKREPVMRQPKTTRPDIENIGKAFLDAATGLVWTDDSQVAEIVIRKFVGAQGEAPYVKAIVRRGP